MRTIPLVFTPEAAANALSDRRKSFHQALFRAVVVVIMAIAWRTTIPAHTTWAGLLVGAGVAYAAFFYADLHLLRRYLKRSGIVPCDP